MKKIVFKSVLLFSLVLSAATFTTCKKEKPVEPTIETPVETVDNTTVEPVEIAPDTELTANVTDATKDFPGVIATVADGEITLTGDIMRERLPALMQSLNALHPKKINNNLNVKK